MLRTHTSAVQIHQVREEVCAAQAINGRLTQLAARADGEEETAVSHRSTWEGV